ncbi:MAG: plastocyanin/azurin family copper-binding protein [Planctomycetia bacterium]
MRLFSAILFLASLATGARAQITIVTQSSFSFTPSTVTVPVGDTVRWVWTSTAHTVTEGTDGILDWDEPIIGFLNASQTSFDHIFDANFVRANPRALGRYDYFCEPHFPGMKGIVFLSATGTSFCSADGSSPVPCPCGNTGSAGRGCNNSTNSGGGKLQANGSAAQDAFTLTATGINANALSIFLQGDNLLASPVVFGDGLRCFGGALKRIAVKNAAGSTVFYPGINEPTVRTKANSLGDSIQSGSVRHYLVYYRDPSTSFCPSATFNATQGLTIQY